MTTTMNNNRRRTKIMTMGGNDDNGGVRITIERTKEVESSHGATSETAGKSKTATEPQCS